MKRCYSCLALLILSPVLLFFGYYAIYSREFAYRISLTVETPAGLRQGSSVIRFFFGPSFGWSSRGISSRGEATFIDLGEGKNVVALLAQGPRGDAGNLQTLVSQAFFGLSPQGYLKRAPIEVAELPVGTRVALVGETIPTLVTFSDLADPNSAKVIAPQRFEAAFGSGYALKSASIETVAPGIWPFNLLPMPWPKWLFGETITRGIEKQLPFLVVRREELRNVSADRPGFRPYFHSFVRESF